MDSTIKAPEVTLTFGAINIPGRVCAVDNCDFNKSAFNGEEHIFAQIVNKADMMPCVTSRPGIGPVWGARGPRGCVPQLRRFSLAHPAPFKHTHTHTHTHSHLLHVCLDVDRQCITWFLT